MTTAAGAISQPAATAVGVLGGAVTGGKYALNFVGAADVVTVPNSASLTLGAGSFSFEWWMQPTSLATAIWDLWGKTLSSPFNLGGIGFGARQRANGQFEFARGCGAGVATTRLSTAPGFVAAGVLIHCVLTFDFATGIFAVYKNGVFAGSITYAGVQLAPYVDTFPLTIGKGGNTNWTNGPIDSFRIYSRVLSVAEVAARFAGTEIDLTGLVGWWRFNEGSGTVALDSSGNNNVGAITGATYVAGIDPDSITTAIGVISQPSAITGALAQP